MYPALAVSVARTFALPEASKLRSLFDEPGFADFATDTVVTPLCCHRSAPITAPLGAAAARPVSQALVGLSDDIRSALKSRRRRTGEAERYLIAVLEFDGHTVGINGLIALVRASRRRASIADGSTLLPRRDRVPKQRLPGNGSDQCGLV